MKPRADEGLPPGWVMAPLGDIASVQLGKMLDRAKHTKGKALPYLRNVNVRWCSIETHDLLEMYFDDDEIERYTVRKGDLVVCEGGEPGRAAIWMHEHPVMYQKALHRVRPCAVVIPEWLLLGLRLTSQTGVLDAYIGGSTIRHLTRESFLKVPLPLPPVAEQRRIVARLEALEARSRRARAELAAIPPLLDQARQSLLAAAFRGDLTRKWREENPQEQSAQDLLEEILQSRRRWWEKRELKKLEKSGRLPRDEKWKDKYVEPQAVSPSAFFDGSLPETWIETNWDTLSNWVTYGFTRPMPHVEDGPHIVTAKNVRGGQIDFVGAHRTTQQAFAALSDKDRPEPGDILITKDGTIGRAAIVPDVERFCINQSVAIVYLRSCPMDRRFLLWAIEAPFTQRPIAEQARGMAIQHLSITDFAQLTLPLPPLAEQQEIVRRLEAAFARIDAAAEAHAAAVAELDRLDQALLAKAFRGEIVPQDPADEPAAVTLQRLRAPREVFDPVAYLFQFIPALLAASGGGLPYARLLEGCGLLLGPRDLIRLVEPIGGAAARQHFEKFAQPLQDGSFDPVLRKLIEAGAIAHDPKRNHTLRLVKAPPVAPLIAEDAGYIASVLSLVPTETLQTVAARQRKKLCPKPAPALLATM